LEQNSQKREEVEPSDEDFDLEAFLPSSKKTRVPNSQSSQKKKASKRTTQSSNAAPNVSSTAAKHDSNQKRPNVI
jgi:hypothetical protein